MKFTYEGDNKREGLVSFMRNPQQTPEKPKQEEWSETESNVLHLTESTFDDKLKVSVLYLFIIEI
jgi:protein disulfide-isomerase/protein disulfide isomerase family A protein 5